MASADGCGSGENGVWVEGAGAGAGAGAGTDGGASPEMMSTFAGAGIGSQARVLCWRVFFCCVDNILVVQDLYSMLPKS